MTVDDTTHPSLPRSDSSTAAGPHLLIRQIQHGTVYHSWPPNLKDCPLPPSEDAGGSLQLGPTIHIPNYKNSNIST